MGSDGAVAQPPSKTARAIAAIVARMVSPPRLSLVPSPRRRKARGIGRGAIAAPRHVQVGAQQDEVVAVDIARVRVGGVQQLEWRAERLEGLFEAGAAFARAAEAQQ